MILFFSGVFATVGLVAMVWASYTLGKRNTPKRNLSNEEQTELEKQRKKQMAIKKDFDNLMSYDLDKAYARKVK